MLRVILRWVGCRTRTGYVTVWFAVPTPPRFPVPLMPLRWLRTVAYLHVVRLQFCRQRFTYGLRPDCLGTTYRYRITFAIFAPRYIHHITCLLVSPPPADTVVTDYVRSTFPRLLLRVNALHRTRFAHRSVLPTCCYGLPPFVTVYTVPLFRCRSGLPEHGFTGCHRDTYHCVYIPAFTHTLAPLLPLYYRAVILPAIDYRLRSAFGS